MGFWGFGVFGVLVMMKQIHIGVIISMVTGKMKFFQI